MAIKSAYKGNYVTSILSKISLLVLLVVLCACSGAQSGASLRIMKLDEGSLLRPDQPFAKSVYDARSRSLYCLDRVQQQVNIYRNGALVNRLGSSDATRFLKLSDIALDPDGSVLCLDGLSKRITKFGPDGEKISSFDLTGMVQPELLCMSPDRTVFVYDAAPMEIICLNSLSLEENYRFGRFQLPQPTSLLCSSNQVVVQDQSAGSSYVFSILGELIGTYEDLRVYDDFNNAFVWNGMMLSVSRSNSWEEELSRIPSLELLTGGRELRMSYSQGTLLLHNNVSALIYRVIYHNRYE